MRTSQQSVVSSAAAPALLSGIVNAVPDIAKTIAHHITVGTWLSARTSNSFPLLVVLIIYSLVFRGLGRVPSTIGKFLFAPQRHSSEVLIHF